MDETVDFHEAIPTFAVLDDNTPRLHVIVPCYERTSAVSTFSWSLHQNTDIRYSLDIVEKATDVAAIRNIGLDRTDADLVAFVDQDVMLPPFWASKMISILQWNKNVGVVCAKTTSFDLCADSEAGSVGQNSIVHMIPPGICFVYYRSRVSDEHFDEGYKGAFCEATDWMLKVQEKGLLTVVVGNVWAIHGQDLFSKEGEWESSQYRLHERWSAKDTNGLLIPKDKVRELMESADMGDLRRRMRYDVSQ